MNVPRPRHVYFAFHMTTTIGAHGTLRDVLQSLKVAGYDLTWHESRGWFSRTWTIRAQGHVVDYLEQVGK